MKIERLRPGKPALFFFWFIVLQLILFLPLYFMHTHIERTRFFPFSGIRWDEHGFSGIFLINGNHNPFRIQGEFLLLLTLSLVSLPLPGLHRIFKLLTYLLYPLILAFNLYFHIYYQLYGIVPNFQDDWLAVKEVVPIFMSSMELNSIGNILLLLLGGILVIGLLVILIRQLFNAMKQVGKSRLVWLIWAGLLLFTAYGSYKYQKMEVDDFRLNIQWITPAIAEASKAFDNPFQARLNSIVREYGSYANCPLEEQKNVYLIFVEAYGSVAHFADSIRSAIISTCDDMTDSLRKDDWHMASAFSRSTILGGRSWLSFTTGLTGTRLRSHQAYKALLGVQHEYPHMVRYFNHQGYHTTWISTMRINEKTEHFLPEDSLNAFWGFDRLLFHNRIPYHGYIYDTFGGVPDQFAIGYYHKTIASQNQPHFVFFITTTTHGPFFTPPPILENWEDLNSLYHEGDHPYFKSDGDYLYRYGSSMEYILKMWTHFIRRHGTEDDIFILIGDHQPAALEFLMEGKYDKFATPMHVISKDAEFINSFLADSMSASLYIDPNQTNYLDHGGLYSRLIHHLQANYGDPDCKPVEIRKSGINPGENILDE